MLLRRALPVLGLVLCAAVLDVSTAAASPALGNQTCRLGAVYVIEGHTGTMAQSHLHLSGPVVVRGAWGSGPWRVLNVGEASAATGFYRLVLRPAHRGVLHLRLATPDNITYPVTLTVT